MHPLAAAALVRAGYPDHHHVAHQFEPSELGRIDLLVALDRRHHQTLRGLGADPGRLVLLRSFDAAAGRGGRRARPLLRRRRRLRRLPGHDRRRLRRPRRHPGAPTGTALWRGLTSSARIAPAWRGSPLVRRRPPAGIRGRESCDIVPTWSHAGSAAAGASSRRRRRVLLLLIYFAFFSGGSGSHAATTDGAPTTPPPRRSASPSTRPSTRTGRATARPVTFGFGGDVHFAGAVGTSLAKNPSTALGTTIPQLFSGTAAAHGQPRDGGDRRDLPRAPEQAVHLRRAGHRRHRAQERHDHVGHGGQRPRGGLRPPGAVTEPRHRRAGPVPDHRHREQRGTGLRPLPGRPSTANASRSSRPPR